jgi:hypothetical protein
VTGFLDTLLRAGPRQTYGNVAGVKSSGTFQGLPRLRASETGKQGITVRFVNPHWAPG